MDPATIDRLAQYGLPTVILFAVGWGLWKAVIWSGREVVVPLRDRIAAHLAKIETTMDSLKDSAERQADSIESLRVAIIEARCRAPANANAMYPLPHKPA